MKMDLIEYKDDHEGEGLDCCKFCGKHWTKHLGVAGTCNQVMRLKEAFKQLHIIAYSQIDADAYNDIRKLCESIGFEHDMMDWKENNE
jgi:hypothetical protein